jgi:hypothetical protein
MMMFMEQEVGASFEFLSFHCGHMYAMHKFLHEEGNSRLEFHKKHPRQHQHATTCGMSFDTSTKPLNQQIGFKSYNLVVLNKCS